MFNNKDENDATFGLFLNLTPSFCALMVIGIHSYNAGGVDQLSITARIEGSLSHGLFTAAVPIFMFLSGFLFFRNANNLRDVIAKQKRRLTSDLIPFLGWSGLYYFIFTAAYILLPSNNEQIHISIAAIVKEIVFYKYIFPMWFMFQLLVYIALALVVFKMLENTKLSMIVLSITAVLAYLKIAWTVDIDNDTRTIFAFNFFFYYFAGAIASKHQKQFFRAIDRFARIHWVILGFILIIVSFLAGLAFDILPVYNHRIMVPAVAAISFVAFYKLSKHMVLIGGLGVYRIPTMIIYGLHPLIGIVVGRMLDVVGINKMLSYFIMFFLVTCITICGAIIMKKIPITNFIFNGNRK